jgi:catechol 2,3-dioxygenase-like lactoylglutathione lyase family enzyme
MGTGSKSTVTDRVRRGRGRTDRYGWRRIRLSYVACWPRRSVTTSPGPACEWVPAFGHIHLQVGDIAQAEAVYCDLLGFDVMARMASALFVSAGGYHHHIGLNTWHSRGASPAPAGTAGLRFFTLDLPNEEARRAVVARIAAAGLAYAEAAPAVVVRDPWQNTILLRIGSASDGRAATRFMAAVPMG